MTSWAVPSNERCENRKSPSPSWLRKSGTTPFTRVNGTSATPKPKAEMLPESTVLTKPSLLRVPRGQRPIWSKRLLSGWTIVATKHVRFLPTWHRTKPTKTWLFGPLKNTRRSSALTRPVKRQKKCLMDTFRNTERTLGPVIPVCTMPRWPSWMTPLGICCIICSNTIFVIIPSSSSRATTVRSTAHGIRSAHPEISAEPRGTCTRAASACRDCFSGRGTQRPG